MAEILTARSLSSEDRKSIASKSTLAGLPAYIGPDGKIYDATYNPIEPIVVEAIFERFRETRAENEAQAQNQQVDGDANKGDKLIAVAEPQIPLFLPSGNWEVISKVPKADDYENYYDFEQAMLDWKAEVDNVLGYLRLPCVIGRTYHRPTLKHEREETKTADDQEEREQEEDRGPANATPNSKPEEPATPPAEREDEEYEKRFEENLDDVTGSTPWDAYCVPPEPDPLYYESYEVYEAAMMHWMDVCLQHLSSNLPPEASQFQELLGLTAVQVEAVDEETKAQSGENADGSSQEGSSIVIKGNKRKLLNHTGFVPLHETAKFVPPMPPVPSPLSVVSSAQNMYKRLSMDARSNLHKILDAMLDQVEISRKKYNRPTAPLLPRLHGTVQRKNSEIVLRAQTSPIRPVRRTDLTPTMISSCQDAPHKIEKNLVEFIVPEYDKAFDYASASKMTVAARQKFIDESRKAVVAMTKIDWLGPFESWYYPMANVEETKKVSASAKQSAVGGSMTFDTIRALLEKPMLLDAWDEFLDSQGKTMKIYEMISQEVGSDMMIALLAMMSDSNSDTLHYRLCSLVLRLLGEPSAPILLNSFVHKANVMTLYRLAWCLCKRLTPEVEIVQFDEAYSPLISFLTRGACDDAIPITSTILSEYYLSLVDTACDAIDPINKVLVDKVKAFKSSVLTNLLKTLQAGLSKALTGAPEYKSSVMFKIMNSRSAKLCSFFLFITVRVLTNPVLAADFQVDGTDLIQSIRSLCRSKLMHTRFAGRLLYNTLQTHKLWTQYFSSVYIKKDLLLDDLLDFRRKGKPEPPANLLPPKQKNRSTMYGMAPQTAEGPTAAEATLLTILATDFVKTVVKADMSPHYEYVLDQFIFHGVLKVVLEAPREIISIGSGIATLASALAHIAHISFTKDLIRSGRSQYNPKLRETNIAGPKYLEIHHQDLRNIMNFVVAVPAGPFGYAVKSNMLVCFRHLLKSEDVFSLIKVEPDLYQKLIIFCRDGNDREFNRNSWRLFFQIIRYHNGVMEHLIKTNQLGSFLEIVDTNAGKIIITNGLHYLSKLFKMHSLETARIESGKKGVRPDTKTMDKDVKALLAFYTKSRLFIRIHMIYQNLISKRPGMAFNELCEFYKMLRDSPTAKPLLKDLQKSGEYKDGIAKVLAMYDQVEPPVDKKKK